MSAQLHSASSSCVRLQVFTSEVLITMAGVACSRSEYMHWHQNVRGQERFVEACSRCILESLSLIILYQNKFCPCAADNDNGVSTACMIDEYRGCPLGGGSGDKPILSGVAFVPCSCQSHRSDCWQTLCEEPSARLRKARRLGFP